jgi:hypothetical protein
MSKPFGAFTDSHASRIVCQVKHELLQIKYLQAPKMRGFQPTLSPPQS